MGRSLSMNGPACAWLLLVSDFLLTCRSGLDFVSGSLGFNL